MVFILVALEVVALFKFSKIEKYKYSGKYIVYFKDKAKQLGPIKLSVKRKGAAPQVPQVKNFEGSILNYKQICF